MAQPTSELERLAERRRRLVNRSNDLRAEAAYELANLSPAIAWFERGYWVTQSVRSFWPIVAGVAAFFFTRRKGSWLGKVGKLWSLWRLVRTVLGMWRSASASKPPTTEDR